MNFSNKLLWSVILFLIISYIIILSTVIPNAYRNNQDFCSLLPYQNSVCCGGNNTLNASELEYFNEHNNNICLLIKEVE